jgi:hypothetical protein
MPKRFIRLLLAALLAAPVLAVAQQPAQAPAPAPAAAAPTAASQTAFLQAADQVLAQMSRLLDLPLLHPLKKSIETKAQIRAYLVKENEEDKQPAKRYADRKALVAFGLVPKGFDLDGFMLNLLTNQIAGLYDPKAQEFYIADWIPLSQQRVVMAHELTHALQDQHFHIEKWVKAARPNDDAESARQAVLEGSAVVSMLDYELLSLGRGVRDMPDIGPMTQAVIGDASSSPDFDKAPIYLRDSLLFPYLSGAVFTQQVLKAGSGWADFQNVFVRPPASTQQVMHPQLYLADKAPPAVTLPNLKHLLGHRWKLLDENVLGEFGLQEVLKQFLGDEPAQSFAPDWWGDRYAILENKQSKSSLLLLRLRLDSEAHAGRFFTAYSSLLKKKHAGASHTLTAPEFLQFDTAGNGGVFFECQKSECFSMEGADRREFDKVTKAMGWPKAPQPPRAAARNFPPARPSAPLPALIGSTTRPLSAP